MPIKILGPDNETHEFPDDMPQHVIEEQMKTFYGPPKQSGLPQPGTQSPASGNVMPALKSDVPPYMSREDAIPFAMAATGNRAIGPVVAQMPGHAYRLEQAKKAADNNADIENKQRVGTSILGSYAKLVHNFNEVPDATLESAIGPGNIKPYSEWYPALHGMTPPEAEAAYWWYPNANILRGVPSEAAWNTQNRFNHLTNGLTSSFMLGAKGLQMTNDKMEKFDSTMKDFMKATNRKEAAHILDDAKALIMNDFALPPDVADAVVAQNIAYFSKKGPPDAGHGASQTFGPQLPSAIPSGSKYSLSRKMWRSPDGAMYDESGKKVQ